MPTSINYPPDARGKWSLPVLLVLIALAVVSFLVPSPFKIDSGRPSKEELMSELNARLREGSFERLYDEADDLVHRNVTKETFVRRMRAAAAKLRDVDGGLNFRRNENIESALTPMGINGLTTVAQTLGEGGKAVIIVTRWDDAGRFVNLSVLPQIQTPPEYGVNGVSHRLAYVNDQLVED
jgi:hypothetical protein